MKIAVIGTGYVGLVSGACLADFGHEVVCIDNDSAKINSIRNGQMPIFEPGLSDLVSSNILAGRLSFAEDYGSAIASAEVVFIAVGTPSSGEDGRPDLSFVHDAARRIAEKLDGFTVIATKSTVPVGTGDEIEEIVTKVRPDAQFSVVANPEFLREGAAIRDFKLPDRIVIGTEQQIARDIMAQVYRPFYLNAAPIFFTDRRTAELIKYAANAFLATKITFINEIADLCEQVGANVQQLARGIGLDNRIGLKFLHPGPGFGGSCFPKDVRALIKTARDAGTPTRILETVLSVNDTRKRDMAGKIASALGNDLRGAKLAILGLTFKPNTDDMREAPSIALIETLQQDGAEICCYDPAGMDQARKILQNVAYADNPYACADRADALVIVTEWEQFRALDLDRLRRVMKRPIVVDLRNVYRSEEMARHQLVHYGVGIPKDR